MSDVATITKKRKMLMRGMPSYLAYLRYLRENYEDINNPHMKLLWSRGQEEGALKVL